MEKFNNSSLFTGYLKQLLHNFNLPTFKVYTREDAEYKNKNGVESPNIVALDLTKSSTTDFVDSTKINNKTFDYVKPYNIQPNATPPKDMIEHYHFEEL